jgi:putative membrane protein
MRHDAPVKKLLIRWLALAAAVFISAAVIPGIEVSGGAWSYFWIALVLGLINAIIGTIVRVVTFPLVLLTLGFFLLIVNTAMLALTARLTDALSITGFWAAFFGALIITIVSSILGSSVRRVTS